VAGVAGVTGCWRGSDSVAGYGGPRRLVHINMNALAALIKSLCLHLFAPPLPPPSSPLPPISRRSRFLALFRRAAQPTGILLKVGFSRGWHGLEYGLAGHN